MKYQSEMGTMMVNWKSMELVMMIICISSNGMGVVGISRILVLVDI